MRLEIPYFKQFNEHACVVASVAMVLRFYGVRINQKEVYNKAKVYDPLRKRRIWGCTDAKMMLAIKDTGYKMRLWFDEKKNAKTPSRIKNYFKKEYNPLLKEAKEMGLIKTSKNATIKLIQQLLEKGIPVIAEVHSNTWFKTKKWSPQETHAVVVMGYEGSNFLVNDPYMPYFGENGKEVKVSIKHFQKSWEVLPYYKNSMCILEISFF